MYVIFETKQWEAFEALKEGLHIKYEIINHEIFVESSQ
jgi:hypothetical protein